MKEFELHERFEMEILELMRSTKTLESLIFTGGTMLRLCFRLNRYSVDLDFDVKEGTDFKNHFIKLKDVLAENGCEVTDAQEKFYSFLIECRKSAYPRRLKIEIRKQRDDKQEVTSNIAFTPHAPDLQVRLKTITLRQMWFNKIKALIDRKEIRDAFDLEFILKREEGLLKETSDEDVSSVLETVKSFSNQDYRNKLGNLLAPEDREFCLENRFAFLKSALSARLV